MTGRGWASPSPAPAPVRAPGGGRAAWLTVGLVVVAAVVLVGIGLAGRTGGEPGWQVPGGEPSATSGSTTATPPARVGSLLGPAPACPPGSSPDTPGPADQARPTGPMVALPSAAFDRRAGRLVALAGSESGSETWTFDVCTNTWTRMHPDREPPAGTGQLVYDVDSDVTIASDGTRMWAYDLKADTWTEKGAPAPIAVPGNASLRFYDPLTGLVVAVGDDGNDETLELELRGYDVEADAWTLITRSEPAAVGPHDEDFTYDPSVDRIVAYTNTWTPAGDADFDWAARAWLLDPRTGAWAAASAAAPYFSYGWWGIGPAVAYDETTERVIMLGQGHAAAYDAAEDRWETLWAAPSGDDPATCGTRPECRLGRALVYDPVNGRLVAFGGQLWAGCTWEEMDDAWAFDMATRSWSLILPPTPVPPPSRDLAAEEAAASLDPGRSPWIRPTKVMLHGGPFFTRVPGVADEPFVNTPPVAPSTVADGLLLPECQLWTDGTVWWEQTSPDATSRAWIEIDLGRTYAIDSAVVQADANEDYLLSYRDPETATWAPAWSIPLGEAGGMATRPQMGDASTRWDLGRPIVTDTLRFEATSGDARYSVSEIAVFGLPAP